MDDVPGEQPPDVQVSAAFPTPGPGGPRASDADRDRFASLLEHHFSEGRLTGDEFAERMDRVLRARSLGELYALVADLPDLPAVAVLRARRLGKRRSGRFWRG